MKKAFKWVSLFGGVLVLAVILRLIFLPKLDLLAEPRSYGVEVVYREGSWIWHEFQYTEPCKTIKPKLEGWKKQLEDSGQRFVITDIQDRNMPPETWVSTEHMILSLPMELRQGNKCGFAIGLPEENWWSSLIAKIRRGFGLR